MSTDILFQPFSLKILSVPNRNVIAPMTRALAKDGVPGAAHAEYYRRRAAGGVGLILTEGTVINRAASGDNPGIPFFHGEAALAGWQEVVPAVHAAGGRIGPQIWHTTRSSRGDWPPARRSKAPPALSGLTILAAWR